jgi:sugar phosphate isomerase/epimerase
MQLGFVSAILADQTLEQVLTFARDEGFACVEVMCWPPGRADRRYAGVTHLDITALSAERIGQVQELLRRTGVTFSALGYYPNPLDPDPAHRHTVSEHLKKVIDAAAQLQVPLVTTFIGRDPALSWEAQWPRVREVWPSLVRHAEAKGVRLAIENCPMLFSADEWPGGKNLAATPQSWQRLFEELPGTTVGVNFDPSHLIWQQIDIPRSIRELGPRILHAHAKDTRIDRDRLHQVGILGLGWQTPRLPGLGEVCWSAFFAALNDIGYRGPLCIEVEDRAYEGSLADRQRSLRQSKRFLEQFCL